MLILTSVRDRFCCRRKSSSEFLKRRQTPVSHNFWSPHRILWRNMEVVSVQCIGDFQDMRIALLAPLRFLRSIHG